VLVGLLFYYVAALRALEEFKFEASTMCLQIKNLDKFEESVFM